MNRDKYEALETLTRLSEDKGYLLVQDLIDGAEKFNLSIQDVDWLSTAIAERGVLVHDEESVSTGNEASALSHRKDADEYDDYAQCDYEAIYKKVVELSPDLEPFIEDVRRIVPPQYTEVSTLKYQLSGANNYARQRMIEMHLRFAVRIALQMAEKYDVDIRDTIGEACIGLVFAVDKYDPYRNGPFGSYASSWIYQNVARQIRSRGPQVHYSPIDGDFFRTVYPILKKHGCICCHEWHNCNKVKDIICDELHCDEKVAEIVFSECSVIESLEVISDGIDKDEDFEWLSECDGVIVQNCHEFAYIAYDDSERMCDYVDKHILRDKLQSTFTVLCPKEQKVLCLRYGLYGERPMTLNQVGEMYGLTRERIRQIEDKAIRKITWRIKRAHLDDFLH